MNEIKDLLTRAQEAAKEEDWLRCAQLILGAAKLCEEREREQESVCTHASGQEPWRE